VTLKGTLKEFPLDALLRLLADTKKTGELSLRAPSGEGALGIAEGKVVTSVYGEEQPIPALGSIFGLADAEFEFTPWPDAPPANLEGELQDNLRKAGEYREWIASVRQVIPNDNVRFRLSERAAEQGAVTFTSERWRVVLAVNGDRNVTDLAANLKVDRDAALTTLAGLVRDGIIDAIEAPAEPAAPEPAVPEPAVEAAPPPAPEPAPLPAAEAAPAEPAKPSEDWTAALLRREAEAAAAAPEPPPPPPMPAAQDWNAVPPIEVPPPAPEVVPAPPPADWGAAPAAPAQDWGTPAPEAPAAPAADWGTPAPAANEWTAPAPAEPAPPPPPVDDRLAALFGTPAPAAPEAPAAPADQWSTPATDQWSTPAPAADQWSTPAAEAAPPLADDPRLGALTMPAPAAAPEAPAPAPNEWAPPPIIETPAAPKKKGLFGFGGGKDKAAATAAAEPPIRIRTSGASRAALLAAFSNALLTEYNSGAYGKGKVDERIPSLLMRVDEQADPIDKPLPVVDDRLDVQALERIALPEQQSVPYLAVLVSTIYGDAEKAFGKDKAKKGYKVAQQNVFGPDASALGGDLAGKLPKV
jgi:uncharacterized protein DUF4388